MDWIKMSRTQLRSDIASARDRASFRLGSGREIKKLAGYLWEGETVKRLVTGNYAGRMGLLARTDRRLLFLYDGMLSQRSETFMFGKISSVQWHGGMIWGKIRIFTSGNIAEIDQVPKQDGRLMVDETTNVLTE